MDIKKIILTGTLLAFAPALFAQVGQGLADPVVINAPRFFICIVAGVLLAVGFQVVLSMLSVASGITAIGNIKESANHSHKGKSDSHSTGTVSKITAGMGVWTIITVSISLFFASLLAVKLSLVGANFVGVTLGLVIWASFFTLMAYLEMKTVSTIVGGFVTTIRDGVQAVFSKSSESKGKSIAKTEAHEQARAMRKELEKLFSRHDIDHKIGKYVKDLQPQRLNMQQVRQELKKLITDLRIEEKDVVEDGEIVKKLIIEEAKNTPSISRADVNKLSMVYDELKSIAGSSAPPRQKVRKAIEDFTAADREQIRQYENKIKRYLQAANKEALQPDTIERNIDEILREPSHAGTILRDKVAALDRNTIVRMVSSRGDISSEDANKYADYVEKAISKVSGNASTTSQEASRTSEELRAKVKDFVREIEHMKDYDLPRIKQDFVSLFHAAGKDNESILHKLEYYDKEQLLQMITDNTSLEREQAEPVVSTIVEARDTVMEKATEVKNKVNEKLEEAKQEALQQAENTRKAAAAAAWWMVATALVSAAASALGGILALDAWVF